MHRFTTALFDFAASSGTANICVRAVRSIFVTDILLGVYISLLFCLYFSTDILRGNFNSLILQR